MTTATIDRIDVSVYVIPTQAPESDGTFEWDKTTLVLVQAASGGVRGLGYTYANRATAVFIDEHLREAVAGLNAFDTHHAWDRMRHAVRNVGRPGVASMAIAAVDTALWDLKARLLDLPLARLLGMRRERVLVYGSGGFTSYSDDQLTQQLEGWRREGIRMVKMKIGRHADADRRRVRVAREAVGDDVELFVDANGAYSAREAIAAGEWLTEHGVTWFEEPVSSDDLDGLATVRRHLGDTMDIAAGEYGYDLPYFRRMLVAGAVDVLQADVTRCAGITELLRVGALCEAGNVPLSLHTAPALHLAVACACDRVRHLEYFHEHVRIERLFFDGFPDVRDGALAPELGRSGNGLELREADAVPFLVP